jgi:hypothetical protein
MLTRWANRYEAYCAYLTTPGGVVLLRNGTTIPRRTRKGQAVAVKPQSGNSLAFALC